MHLCEGEARGSANLAAIAVEDFFSKQIAVIIDAAGADLKTVYYCSVPAGAGDGGVKE